MDDDRGVAGVVYSPQGDVLGWVQGQSASGTLVVTLKVNDDQTVELRTAGRFSGETYEGRFQAVNAAGQAMGGGTLKLQRR
ncbi:hypothetical protein SAMN00790413_05204 [Deinococcus hopiensis KR-140]|uniref:Uncharacterized protein n=1 Tax=Deinococcus hopiensis KR-140 TaxID=695939 RepID=A0A1W1UTX1_9DEIO|nr:hypothetical protein SAMN00790413_05204 [Deinococcus hopiensis KR-140]